MSVDEADHEQGKPQLALLSDSTHAPEHWLSQEVTMNRTPQRNTDSSLYTNEENKIHDSDNGKTGNQGDL